MYFGADVAQANATAEQALADAAAAQATADANAQAMLAASAAAGSTVAPVVTAFESDAGRWTPFGEGEANTIETRFSSRWVVTGFNRIPDLDFTPPNRWGISADIEVRDAGDVMTYEVWLSEFGTGTPPSATLVASGTSSGLNQDGQVVGTTEFELSPGDLPGFFVIKTESGPSVSSGNRARIYGVRWQLRLF